MSALRFAGCRHPLDSMQVQQARDGDVRMCRPCGDYRTVREVESVRDLVPRSGATPDPQYGSPPTGELDPAELPRRIANAAGKGQVALLVVDAAGVVVVGLKATGGLTKLEHRPADGLWVFEGALSGKLEVMDGSYALRNRLGTEHTPEVWTQDSTNPHGQQSYERHQPALPPIPQPGQENSA